MPNSKELARTAEIFRAISIARSAPFRCYLDEQPSDLVPDRSRPATFAGAGDADLIVNPSFRYQTGTDWPVDVGLPGLSKESFLSGYPLAWIRDPGTNLWVPYWVRGEWAELLGSLTAGEPAPSDLSPSRLDLLKQSRLLVPHEYSSVRRRQWDRLYRDAQLQVQSQGYAILRDLIHPFHLAAMRRYYRNLVATGRLQLGHGQVPLRYTLHDELLASFFHHQFKDLVSTIVDGPVKPSYVFFASYQPGAVLHRHLDREQCQFSISFLVDYVPEPEDTCGWPLFLEKQGPRPMMAAADLGIGDGVVYKGCELFHHREALPEGHQSTSIFFHYVPQDFSGDLW